VAGAGLSFPSRVTAVWYPKTVNPPRPSLLMMEGDALRSSPARGIAAGRGSCHDPA